MTVSTEKRTLIVTHHKKGKTTAQIAEYVQVPVRTVRSILQQYRERSTIIPMTSPGRPRLLSPREEREIVLTLRRDPNRTPSSLTHTFAYTGKPKVSADTVRRTLRRGGLKAAKMIRKRHLTPAQRHARLEWAKEYAKKPATFWDSVIFSD